jgi:hypothetical protein
MKRIYIQPTVYFEELEIDSVMNAHLSQWKLDVHNEATDNYDEHGTGLGGSDNSDPDPSDIPVYGD